jgi:hypothetical protein
MNKGIRFLNEEINTEYYGLVDDVLVNEMGELVMLDTKSTSKNGFSVTSTGYLYYFNTIKDETDLSSIMRFK